MFERYTEKARQVIFFARYESSRLGSPTIGNEHLLLGLLKENSATLSQHLKVDASELTTRLRSIPAGEPIATSVDLPLNDNAKRALAYAAEEAEQMGHMFIGTEHLLLGIMHEDPSGIAASALRAAGAPSFAEVRKSISDSEVKNETPPGRITRSEGLSQTVKLVDRESGRETPLHLPSSALPIIGDALQLTGAGDDAREYRATDVRWAFHRVSSGQIATLGDIQILVVPEKPN